MKEIARMLNKARGLSWVERFNFQPRHQHESVAAHSGIVALFVAALAPASERNALVFAAVTHDLEEGVTGDCPALVKKHVSGWSDVVAKAETELFKAAVGPQEREIQDAFMAARHLAETSPVVKLADLFSAIVFARTENEMGNTAHFGRIERELIYSIVKLAQKPTVSADVCGRAMNLLEALGFDSSLGLEIQSDISHL